MFEWHECINQLKPYVFRIHTPDGMGTGWLLYTSETNPVCAVVTAAHVIDHAHFWEEPIRVVHHASGNTLLLRASDRAINIDFHTDTAALSFDRGSLDLPKEPLALFKKEHHLKQGVQIGWLGFPNVGGLNLCYFSGDISAHLVDERTYLVDGVAINGVSGGPAFRRLSKSAEMVGIVSAYIPNKATGEALPGVALIRDVERLHDIVEGFKTLDQAKAEETKPQEPPATAAETDAPAAKSAPGAQKATAPRPSIRGLAKTPEQ